jgi:oligopeptidase B
VRIRDLDTGLAVGDTLADAHGDVVWANDGRHLFYTVIDVNHRPQAVKLHRLGTEQDRDTLVYEEADPGFFVGVSLTESRRFVVVDTHDHTTSESWLVPADEPDATPRLVVPRERDVEYDVTHHGERLLVRTNADGAEDFKLVEAPIEQPGRESWRDLVAHVPGRLIVSFEVFSGHLVRLERENALPRIVVSDLESGAEHVIEHHEAAYRLALDNGYEFDTTRLRFEYSSPTTPARVYDYDMRSRERTLRKEQSVPSGHDPSRYVTRRLLAPAPDGEQIPVTVLELRDTPHDGSAPLLIYGYGAYGISMPASFSTNRLSLVDRGFVYAIAHVRGGMERGYRWYREGKLEHKTNSFTDFIAVAEHLVAEGYTSAGRIAAHGASAGGMLMGAIANMRPDLFAAVVAEVPFVDVLSTMCDETLPLTPPEWNEWGDPLHDPQAHARIRDYSPYDNVRAQDYPAILATGGVSDPRVTYWEPAKWVARLRELRTNDAPLLLKINLAAGHGGASGRFERLEEIALAYAFVIRQLAPDRMA